jgi:hypothetical protein
VADGLVWAFPWAWDSWWLNRQLWAMLEFDIFIPSHHSILSKIRPDVFPTPPSAHHPSRAISMCSLIASDGTYVVPYVSLHSSTSQGQAPLTALLAVHVDPLHMTSISSNFNTVSYCLRWRVCCSPFDSSTSQAQVLLTALLAIRMPSVSTPRCGVPSSLYAGWMNY